MKIHRFNETGISRFHQFLDDLTTTPGATLPTHLLTDPELATPAGTGEVEQRTFGSRMDCSKYLDELFKTVSSQDLQRDVGLWTWLSLFYFDQLCPPSTAGLRKPGERARYVPEVADFRKYYRHLLAGPYRVFRAHRDQPDRALILLCGPLHKPGEVVEQLLARQEVVTNPHAIALATTIYYDPSTRSFRRGAAGKGSGSARRLMEILNQFDVTWDLYSMEPAGIRAKLPREFARFLSKSPP